MFADYEYPYEYPEVPVGHGRSVFRLLTLIVLVAATTTFAVRCGNERLGNDTKNLTLAVESVAIADK
jgi:hypothetical protein